MDTIDKSRYISDRLAPYLRRNLSTILHMVPFHFATFLLFDKPGQLLECFGKSEHLNALETAGILPGLVWPAANLGHNAVTAGMADGCMASSAGESHQGGPLAPFALYFCPIRFWERESPFTVVDHGGLALAVPAKEESSGYLLSLSAIVHDLVMTLHFNQTANLLYEKSGQGIMIVDTYINPGQATITYYNELLFQNLGIQKETLNFRPVETLIDPRPYNFEFWDMLEQLTPVQEQYMTLRCHGQDAPIILSSTVFNQPSIDAQGLIFYVTTPLQISAGISKKMGNNAIRTFGDVVGRSTGVRSAVHRAKLLAKTGSNVMIMGESGVGKDVFAQAIHNASQRAGKPFIALNCGAMPRDLIASELFGYASGAFTGARRQGNIGKFELANGGTIFLDEIGELPLDLQATLLRVVEQKQFMRLGSNELIDIDVKIIAATNADISGMIEQKLFRADLYYRLSTLQLTIPPLREREEDVALLAEFFIQKVSERIQRDAVPILTEDAKRLLLELPWLGNVRELQNLMESIVQLYPGPVIEAKHIQENLNVIMPRGGTASPSASGKKPKRELLTEEEIRTVLTQCKNNRSKAARTLGITRKTLYRNLERLGM